MAKFQPGNPGGPGRKPKADKNAGAVERAEKQIRDRLPSLIDNMLALSDGIFVEEFTLEGNRIVYQRPPDRAANQYLIDRIMGKPTERREMVGVTPEQAKEMTTEQLEAELKKRGVV
jgi:hypothetical protein